MKYVNGDIWDFFDNGKPIVIPTNGSINMYGALVMGRGIALEAKNKIVSIEYRLGQKVKQEGNRVYYLGEGAFSFPVKHQYHERADLDLIARSCEQLKKESLVWKVRKNIYIPRVGTGNGKLKWDDVKPVLERSLHDQFICINWRIEK